MSSQTLSATRPVYPPLHPFLALIVATCLTGGLLTDLAYWRTAEITWANFSAWLVSAGTILAWLFAIAGVVELALRPAIRARQGILPYALATLAALALATVNTLVHARDAWTSVVPAGLVLSALTVLVLVVAAVLAVRILHPGRHGVDR